MLYNIVYVAFPPKLSCQSARQSQAGRDLTSKPLRLYIYIYIYIFVYLYIEIERERERDLYAELKNKLYVSIT